MIRSRFPAKALRFTIRSAVLFLFLGFLSAFTRKANAEVELSIFTGVALSQDSDLRLRQRGGTDLTFRDVPFEGRDFDDPPYYGARALWFPSEDSHWGFGAEFFHMKMYADTDSTVHVTGRRNGVGVDDNERVDGTIQSFSLSHGLTYALGDSSYRRKRGQRGGELLSHLEPYVGVRWG